MTIKVEPIDIQQGKHCAEYCPVSLAIRKKQPRAWVRKVWVTPLTIRIGPYFFPTPPNVQTWILDYDAGKKVEPFEFKLEREGV